MKKGYKEYRKFADRLTKELAKCGIEISFDKGDLKDSKHKLIEFDANSFPQSLIDYNSRNEEKHDLLDPDRSQNKVPMYIAYTHKGAADYAFDRVKSFMDKLPEELREDKGVYKKAVKCVVKAVKKYLDKCADGYQPKEDTSLCWDMSRYVSKRTEKYLDKLSKKLEKAYEDSKDVDDDGLDM